MKEEQTRFITKVYDGEEAIVITLLARNPDGSALLDSQLELAAQMAKHVVQTTGAEVNASGSLVSFAPAAVASGGAARLDVALTIVPPEEN